MSRLWTCTAFIIGILTIVSCVPISQLPTPAAPPPVAAQPTSTTVLPAATAQPTATAVPPTATKVAPVATAVPPTAAPTVAPTATSAPASQAATGGPQKLNLDDYMPKGTGRDLLMSNCTACHSFVPIVNGQRTRARWDNIRTGHRDAVLGLSDKDYNAIYDYLAENFNDTKPAPQFPAWFVQGQTSTGE